MRQLHVTSLGLYPSAPRHYVERDKGIEQAIFIYCLGGKGFLRLEGAEFSIMPGEAVFVPPKLAHAYGAERGTDWSKLWVHFDGEETQHLLESLGVDRGSPKLFVADIPQIRGAFEEIFACLNYNYSDAGLLAMSGELTRLFAKIKLHSNRSRGEGRAAEDRILASIDFMERHLDMAMSLESLAARADQSVAHYGKLFKERTSQSPLAYFNQLKIRKACELLDHTNQSVKEVARQLGFSDSYYFSRLFKKIQGCSPVHYRRSEKS